MSKKIFNLRLPGDCSEIIKDKINKIAKKVNLSHKSVCKIKITPINVEVINKITGKKEIKLYYDYNIEIKLPIIKYENYIYKATLIKNDDEIEIYPTDDYDNYDFSKYYNIDFRCDHCNKNRKRKKVHLFINDEGKDLMIASTCSKEYFGVDINDKINNIIKNVFYINKQFKILDEEFDHSSYKKIDIEFLSKLTYSLITKEGYVSQKKADIDVSTKDYISMLYHSNCYSDMFKSRNELIDNTPKSFNYKKIFDFWNDYQDNGTSFIHNVKIQFKLYSPKIGLIVWGIYKYMCDVEKFNIEKETSFYNKKSNEFFGVIGNKYQKELYVSLIKPYDSIYGMTYFTTLYDKEGNKYNYVNRKQNLKEKNIVNMKFKIKNHSVYNNIKQTDIYYCKLITEKV